MNRPKAALVEIYDSHEVNLYSQLRFLIEGGFDVTLIISERHKELVENYGTGFKTELVRVTQRSGLALWKELWRIRQIILDQDIRTVVFNTAHSNPVRNFCLLPFPKHVRFFGTLHGVNKLQGSFTQKVISRRIPDYFLLSDYMLEKAQKVPHQGLNFSVFYPIFHPDFPQPELEEKPADTFWIAIPGSVEYKRRDYTSLLEAFAQLPVKPKLKFLLLGNADQADGAGADIKRKVRELGIEPFFHFFSGYVPNGVLHGYLKRADAVMPLIHPINADMEKYLENQISGAFHLAFAYRKPLLMHRFFERYQDFRETSFFYDLPELSSFLAGLTATLAGYAEERHYSNPKWSFAFQQQHFCDFLKAGREVQ